VLLINDLLKNKDITLVEGKEPIFIITNQNELKMPNDIISITPCLKRTKEFYKKIKEKKAEGDPNCPQYDKTAIRPKIYVLLEIVPPALNSNLDLNKKEVD
jgi:hypothetical protein